MGNPEGTFDTKLHEAVRYGDEEEVRVALQQGYDPNLIGLYQWSALHEAAHNGEEEILALLLQKKGDPNKADYLQSRTAMHYASEQGHVKCLQMLLDAGGQYSIKDSTGKNSLDLATPGGRKILEKYKVRDLMLMSPKEARESVMGGKDDGVSPDQRIAHDQSADQCSVSSGRSSLGSVKESLPALGYMHMSVEYHSGKSTLKIRVWQLSDLLLPPPHTSMIHTIYVKSYLQPDKKKETKRKTEECKIESTEGHIHWKKKKELSLKSVFTPASFKFTRALDYTGITNDTIRDKTLMIEVCITQRYSHRSFLIGMVTMPLKSAVKKVVKEKLPLIPCMNHTIPTNMRVYSASELSITNNSGKVFYSNPNFRVSLPDDIDNESDKAASNPDLQPDKYSPSTEVNMNNEYRTAPNVPKLDLGEMPLDESGYSSELHISCPGELESPDSDIQPSDSTFSPVKNASTSIDMTEKSKGKVQRAFETVKVHISPRSNVVTRIQDGIKITDLDEEVPDDIKVDSLSDLDKRVEDWKYSDIKKSSKKKAKNQDSPRETLSWDYYDIPTEVTTETPESATPWTKEAAPVILPMETMMSIHQSNDDKTIKGSKKDKSKKKSKTGSAQAVPGRAIPLVPAIVVTSPQSSLKIRSKAQTETSFSIPDEIPSISVEQGNRYKTKSEALPKDHRIAIDVTETDSKDSACSKTKVHHSERGLDKSAMKFVTELKETKRDSTQNDVNSSLPKPKPRVKKLRKKKEAVVEIEKINAGTDGNITRDAKKLNRDKQDKQNSKTSIALPKKSTAISKDQVYVEAATLDRVSFNRSESDSSVVVDMDRVSFASSDSHVVHLDEEISITELPEDSQLFSEMSFASANFPDVESATSEYHLPERVSPTKYMIPMQVYLDDDTSCDESLSSDYVIPVKGQSKASTTEL